VILSAAREGVGGVHEVANPLLDHGGEVIVDLIRAGGLCNAKALGLNVPPANGNESADRDHFEGQS
jgi:hypothetical protein